MNELEPFRELLREAMQGRGAQARLSEASGIPSPVLGYWRDGKSRPSDTNLKKLAPALGVPYEDLVKMCGYLPGEPERIDPDVRMLEARQGELREVLDGIPRRFWPTILEATLRTAQDMAKLATDLRPVTTPPEPPVTRPRRSAKGDNRDPNDPLTPAEQGLIAARLLSFAGRDAVPAL